MSLLEDKPTYRRAIAATPGDEIVISGISGRFPLSRNIAELEYNLYNKVDMIDDSELRWRHEHVSGDIPKRSGKVHGLEKFDATFFGVNFKEAHTMDPQARILIEHSYEAIIDAGINPNSLKGTRTGVYMGLCFSESDSVWFYANHLNDGYGILGCNRAMIANRVSYMFGLQGQSMHIDTACSSAMTAVDCAFSAIRNGECDAAIVGASNLTLSPHVTLQFAHLGVLAPSGYCCPFDETASGYSRSEAISVIFIQKAKDAKRVYGTLLYSKINSDGYKDGGITYPSGEIQAKLLDQFYKEIHIKPETVDYIEAHGTGTIVGDPEECGAIDKIFCKNRQTPLPVGSIKSNLGHSEGSAGLCSIAKCILVLEKEWIPPNINFTTVHPGIKSLTEKRLQVVIDSQKLQGPLIAVNSFGFGGANAHCLLRANPKQKINNGAPTDKLPRLVNWSGRTKEACDLIHDNLANIPLDAEYIALLQNTQSRSHSRNEFKSYGLFSHVEGENAKCLARNVEHYSGIKRPIVYVFSGMGSQWLEMGTSLLQISIFQETIQKCHDALVPKGIDLIKIITSPDKTTFDNILNSFVGIASIQVAICNVLNELGIKPDYIIGHSVGELGCAYADNCLTAEQVVLCAYTRGLVSLETDKIKGSMAAVGMGYRNIKKLLPSKIDVACHNSADSCTISGPQNEVEKFVASLTTQSIFAKEVPCSNIAYHSRYIADMGPKLLSYLSEIITDPKNRSEKWLSTSLPKNKWDLPESQYCSAQYQTNNLLSPVLFEETALLLPTNVTTIEIAPHGLLQAIIRKLIPNSIYIPLTQRGNIDNLSYFLEALGKVFVTGADMTIEKIYPKVEFPVSRGTPMISPLIRWDHFDNFFVMKYEVDRKKIGEKKIRVSLQDHDFEYISGHIIDGRCLFPAAGYLFMVWNTFSLMQGCLPSSVNIQFEDVRFIRATTIALKTEVEFSVIVQPGTGRFEITEGSAVVVIGKVKIANNDGIFEMPEISKSNYPYLATKDFYKELRLRGYHYGGSFKNVIEARADGLSGKVKWEKNWVSFIDCLMQISILGKDTRSLMIPTRIEKITIDTELHGKIALEKFNKLNPESFIYEVISNKSLGITQCGGIQIEGLHASPVSRRKPPGIPVLELYKFIPYVPTPKLSKTDASRLCVQHALENCPIAKIRTIEVLDELIEPIIDKFKDAVEDLPLTTSDTMILTSQEIVCGNIHVEDGKLSSQSNCMFVIKPNCLAELTFVESALASLLDDGYLISRECENLNVENIVTPQGLKLIAVMPLENETLVLLQKIKRRIPKVPTIVKISSLDKTFEWLETLRTAIKSGAVIAYSENESQSGIVGLINCIRKEPESNSVVCVFIDDRQAPSFDIENPFYKNQLALEMAINVYRDGQWGSYRHLLLEKSIVYAPTKHHAFANIIQIGDLSSMKWMRGPLTEIHETLPLLKVQYSSLNFRDVMLASGKLAVEVVGSSRIDNECVLGLEYSGVNASGTRIMGMLISGAMATHISPNYDLTWECPDHWTLEQAATIPVVYSTVYTALFIKGRIQPGNSILIHAGTGGVGIAAIRVSLAYQLNVFTTVSTNEKKQFLLKTFPALRECQIGNSRDTSFEEMIKLQTNGAGVNFVLNSLAEEKLQASLRCLSKRGRFLEIGKFDMANNSKIGLGEFLKEISFHAVLVDNLFTADRKERMKIRDLLQADIDKGIIQPLPTTVYPANEIEQAMRYLASGKHIGKVLLKIRENPNDEMSLPISLIPRINCNPNASYIIPGGLGGFGLELADWLIIRNARKIVLSSSRGITKPYQSYRIRIWQNYGVNIVVNTSNIATPEGCLELIKEAMKLGPVGGIFNLAVVLRDSIFENQTPDTFKESFGPKSDATRYLDEISRVYCPQLKYFVIFSSVSCGRGNAGQSNYGMTNSIMERIIEQRHRDNLPAKAVQWGAVGEVGLVADMQEDKLDLEIGGTLQQRIVSCLEELDTLLFADCPIVSSMVVAEKRVMGGGGDIITSVMNIMSIRDIKSVSMDATLSELGMDSLMAVEIKQSLEREFELLLSPQDLRSLTFAKLYELAELRQKNSGENKKLNLTGNSLTGISMLIGNLGDETSSLIPVLRLKSNNDKDQFDSAIIIVPGIEGIVGIAMENIASSLNQPTFCVQLRTSIELQTISDITQNIYEHVYNEVTKHTESFYIIGYSFGSIIALQLAHMLENNGHTGHVVLIDGAPELFKKLLYGQLQTDITDDAIQITLVCNIINILFPEEGLEDLVTKVSQIPTWSQRVEKLIELSKNQYIYSQQYLKDLTEGLYNRIILVKQLNEDNISKIHAPITLIRPTEVSVTDIEENYNLSKYTTSTVSIKYIEGNHRTMLNNPQLPSILNEINPKP